VTPAPLTVQVIEKPTVVSPPPLRDPWDRIAEILLLIAVFFSSWSLLRVGTINLTISDIAFLMSLMIVASQGRLSFTPFGPLTPYWLLGLLMMLGGLFVSSVINGDPLRWLNIASQYLVAFLLIPILLMQQNARMTRLMPVVFVLGVALSEVIGIAAYSTMTFHDAETVLWGMLGDGFITGNDRLGSMAGQPNPNGAVVAFALPMLIYARSMGAISKKMALVCWAALIAGTALSASFTGFFAAIVTILCMMVLIGFKYLVRLAFLGVMAAALFVASGAPLPKAFQARVGSAVENGDINEAGTFLNRADLIKEAWGMAEQNSIIGLGADRYRDISAYDNPVHDLYLLVWNEGGAVAFLGLLLLFGLLGVLAFSGLRENRNQGAMACAVVTVFLIYTVSYPHMYSRMWIMPVMVALSTIHARRQQGVGPMPVMRRARRSQGAMTMTGTMAGTIAG
jgi:O-antigen ligase